MLKGLYLTLLVGPSVPIPIPALREVTDAITSVSVTTGTGSASGFQVEFAMSKKSLLQQVLLPAGYFDPLIRVIVIATLNGIPSVLMDGVITKQDMAPSNEPGQSKLTITGMDLTALMDLVEIREKRFPGMSAELQVSTCLAPYVALGLVPAVVPRIEIDVDDPLEVEPTQAGTDLQHITMLARQSGYTFYIEPGLVPGTGVAYWGPEIRIGVPQPALTVNMDAHTNVESLTFSYDALSRTQTTIMVEIPNTGVSIPIPIPDISVLKPPLSLKPATALKFEPLCGVSKLNPVRAILMGMARQSQSADAITGSGTLDVLRYGRILKARQLVGVRGAGLSYDGLYFVKSVTHNIKRGEYKQNFTLAREGTMTNVPLVRP